MQVRWGICGCGLISADFVNAIALLPAEEHKVVALGASSVDRAKQFAQNNSLQDCQCFGSYDELFAQTDIDIIYIGVVNHQHHNVVLRALKAGKNVLCEKPMGLNVSQVMDMVYCARENNCFFMEAFWSRFFPVYKQIRQEISKDNLGDMKFLIADFGFNRPPEMTARVNVQEGGGFLMDIGCYLLQLCQMVFNNAKPSKISIEGWFQPGTGVDNTGSITLVYPGNKIAQLLYSASAETQCRAQIVGTKGRLTIPEFLWSPSVLEKQSMGDPKAQSFCYELPHNKSGIHFNYPRSEGLSYEVDCVRQCLMKGHKECELMTLDESINIAEIMQECRKQLGVKYAYDSY